MFLITRDVVPVPHRVWILPVANPTLAIHRPQQPTNDRGAAVWVAACHLGHVNQQVANDNNVSQS